MRVVRSRQSRRCFLQRAGAAGLVALGGCNWRSAPAPAGPARLAVLTSAPWPTANQEAFREGLRERGYLEGQDLIIEHRSSDGADDRLPNLTADLLAGGPAVLVTAGEPATMAAKQATAATPIVMAVSADPVGNGLVASLPRPGGNITGLSSLATVLAQKRVELLHDTVPGLQRALLVGQSIASRQIREVEEAAGALGIELIYIALNIPEDVERVFASASQQHAEGLIVVVSPQTYALGRQLASLALTRRLPSISSAPEAAQAGGLLAFGVNFPSLWRRSAYYIDRILKGTKPADLPVEQPREFDLVVNLQTARALGITVPEHVLIQATEVIW